MTNMREHANALDWAARWCRWLARASVAVTILATIGQFYSASQISYVNSAFNTPTTQSITVIAAMGTIISGLLAYFLFRVGFIVCSFLSDFARSQIAQQIERGRQIQNQDK